VGIDFFGGVQLPTPLSWHGQDRQDKAGPGTARQGVAGHRAARRGKAYKKINKIK